MTLRGERFEVHALNDLRPHPGTLGRSEEALSDFEVASNGGSATDPYALLAELAAAEIYEGQNRLEEAIEKYEKVRAASPKSKEGKRARKALRRLKRS